MLKEKVRRAIVDGGFVSVFNHTEVGKFLRRLIFFVASRRRRNQGNGAFRVFIASYAEFFGTFNICQGWMSVLGFTTTRIAPWQTLSANLLKKARFGQRGGIESV